MDDETKTRQELIAELAAARQQVAELQATSEECRLLEQALRESAERFRVALQNSNLVVYNQDRDLRYTWIHNPLLGFTPEGILGRTDADLLLPEDAAPLEEIKRQVLETGTGRRETVRTTIEGQVYYYDLTVEPLRDAHGEIVGVTGASRDMTDRVQARKALEESEERYRLLAENATDVVWITDLALRTTYVSPSIERLRGYTVEEVMSQRFDETVTPASLAVAMAAFREGQAIEQSEERDPHRVRTLELEFLRKDGATVWTDSRISYIRSPDGEPLAITGVTRDISERKRMEQTLQAQAHALGERVKELNCLYGMSRLREQVGVSLEEILQGAVELIPPAWQYPEITAARVTVDDLECRTENYREDAPCYQSVDIVVHGQVCGAVEVCYVEVPAPRPADPFQGMPRPEAPFLQEEGSLLSAIAERLGRITEHMRAEQEYQTMLRTAIDGFWLCDTQGAILDVNDALCEMLGYSRGELLALTIPDVEAMESPEEVARHIAKIVNQGYDRFESRLRCKDGRVIDVEASVSYMAAVGGRFFTFLRDITERKWAEAVLQRARRDLEVRVEERTADLHRGHQREQVLNALLRLSMEEISLEEQLERALDEILSIDWLPVQPQGGIFLAVDDDPSGEAWLELRAQRGFAPASQVACRRIDFGQCLCGRAAASGELLFAEHGDPRHEIEHEAPEPYHHYCVPILSGDRSIGTIVLYLEHGYPRDAHQEEFLRAVAHTLAGIIERKQAEVVLREREQQLRTLNQQLEDHQRRLEKRVVERTLEIERRRQVAESLREMVAILNSNRPLDEILSHIVLVARQLLGSETSAIYHLAGHDGAFEVQTVAGQRADLASPLQLPPGYRQALQAGQPIAVSDAALAFPDSVELAGSVRPEDLAGPYPSLLAVPLIVADDAYGGLVLYYSEPRVFSGEDVELAVAFADQAALAIENARLHQQAEEAAILEERERLARDLHDSVTQSLYSITLLAEGWKRLDRAGRLEDTDDPLGELGEIAQQALKEMRLLVHELRPPDLEEVGLLGALHARLGAVEKRAGVDARLVASDVLDLSPPLEECLYRIAIEALNNALKHAGATEVTVTLQAAGDGVALEVRDNGCGFDTGRMDELGGVGLNSMRERAEGQGGELAIESEPGEGTSVQVKMEAQGSS